jgi:hypothetical protein
MPADIYTKAVLTIIAAAVVVIALQGSKKTTEYVGSDCGNTVGRPCYVATPDRSPLDVRIR